MLHKELEQPIDALRAKPSQHLPTVLSKAEVQQLFHQMSGLHLVMAKLLYGSGIRLMESGARWARLRVKDLEFERRQLIVRDGKGQNDRVTLLPESLIAPAPISAANCTQAA